MRRCEEEAARWRGVRGREKDQSKSGDERGKKEREVGRQAGADMRIKASLREREQEGGI